MRAEVIPAPLEIRQPYRRKVLVGNSGGEFGVRDWLTALDADTDSVAWWAYSTGPDTDALSGPDFKPFYAQDQGKDLGGSGWPPEDCNLRLCGGRPGAGSLESC